MSSANQNPEVEQPAISGFLHSHRILQFSGPDAATFLQGYLTCDTDQITAAKAIAGAFTNLKGRVVANGWVWGSVSDLYMLVSAELSPTCAEFLKPYLNFAKTTLVCLPDLPTASLSSKTMPGIEVGPGKYLLTDAEQLTTPLNQTDHSPDISAAWLSHTIDHNEVLVTAATSGTLLPQMLGLTELGAVSFEKGCYLGQEVIARAQHLGAVKRQLQRIEYRCDQTLPAGATLADEAGKRVAVVINATQPSQDTRAAQALVVRRRALELQRGNLTADRLTA